MDDIIEDKLEVTVTSEKDDFSLCDFKEEDGSDPLGVDDFIHNLAPIFQKYNLCVIYTVKYNGKTVGFFTLSMGGLMIKHLRTGDKLEQVSLISYPALFLGNMGVERKFRHRKIGSFICKFCIGLAKEYSNKIGCGYVILESSMAKLGFYKKFDFFTSGKENKNGRIWMYRRIYSIHYLKQILENMPVGEYVSVVKNPKTGTFEDSKAALRSNNEVSMDV